MRQPRVRLFLCFIKVIKDFINLIAFDLSV